MTLACAVAADTVRTVELPVGTGLSHGQSVVVVVVVVVAVYIVSAPSSSWHSARRMMSDTGEWVDCCSLGGEPVGEWAGELS